MTGVYVITIRYGLTMLLRVVPDEAGPRSFPETSGGNGVHVGVTLTRRQG